MKLPKSIAVSALTIAIMSATPLHAATLTTPAAHLCTLSIPTTDTKVRPKATGFRNEGTSSAFVICAFDSNPAQGYYDAVETSFDPVLAGLTFASLDAQPHAFACTGVNSFPGGATAAPMQYVQKTVVIDPASDPYPYVEVDWTKADFGGAEHIPTSGVFSVTCLLPPQVSIMFGVMVTDS